MLFQKFSKQVVLNLVELECYHSNSTNRPRLTSETSDALGSVFEITVIRIRGISNELLKDAEHPHRSRCCISGCKPVNRVQRLLNISFNFVGWDAFTDKLMFWCSVGWNAITLALRCRRCYFSNSANRLCLASEKPQMRPTLFLNMLKYASCAKGCISSRTASAVLSPQAEGLLTEFSSC